MADHKRSQVDLAKCLSEAVEAAKKAGSIIRSSVGSASREHKDEAGVDLVTKFDRQCERAIFDHLTTCFVEHRCVGEESSAEDNGRVPRFPEPTWVVDPIDGTTNFIHGLPMVAVSIALFVERQPVVGVIFNPLLDMLFTATKGSGAYCNGVRMPMYGRGELACIARASPVQTISEPSRPDPGADTTITGLLRQAILLTEGGHSRESDLVHSRARTVHKLLTECQVDGIRSYASAAMSLAFLANGAADIYFEHGIHIWDVGAGCLLLEEAGGYWFGSSAFDAWSTEGPGTGKLFFSEDTTEDFYGRKFICVRNPQLGGDDQERKKVESFVRTMIQSVLDNPVIESD